MSPGTHSLDIILDGICDALQLPPLQFQDAKEKYEAVSAWLARCPKLGQLNPEVYPQGSVAIGTTVKPRAQDEHDVDLVLELLTNEPDPLQVYELVHARLAQNGQYSHIIERKNRCLRLNYAGKFHLDILPAKPVPTTSNGAIKVPDRELGHWSDSNPRGFRAWFLARAEDRFMEARAQVEPLPPPEETDEKPPLKRVVQLMKRRRDIVFDGGEGDAPRSIVLTTLSAQGYEGELTTTGTLEAVLGRVIARISETPGILEVPNPTNPRENFAEKWTPKSYGLFVEFVHKFRRDIVELQRMEGLEAIQKKLSEMFGERYSEEAMRSFGKRRGREKAAGKLRAASGTAGLVTGSSGVRVPRHDFYGG